MNVISTVLQCLEEMRRVGIYRRSEDAGGGSKYFPPPHRWIFLRRFWPNQLSRPTICSACGHVSSSISRWIFPRHYQWPRLLKVLGIRRRCFGGKSRGPGAGITAAECTLCARMCIVILHTYRRHRWLFLLYARIYCYLSWSLTPPSAEMHLLLYYYIYCLHYIISIKQCASCYWGERADSSTSFCYRSLHFFRDIYNANISEDINKRLT